MKKTTKLCALGISLSALTQTMGQDISLPEFNNNLLPQNLINVENFVAQNPHLQIAQDSNSDILARFEAAEILKGMPGFEQEAGQAYLSIAQDPTVISYFCLGAAKILKDMPGFSQKAADICLSIAQNKNGDILYRLEAAKILKDIPEFTQQAVKVYFSIAQGRNFEISFRLKAAKVLKDIPEFAQEAVQVYLSIAHAQNVNASQYLEVAKVLKDIPKYDQEAAEICLSIAIAQDSDVDGYYRLDAAEILRGMTGFEKQAEQAYLSIARDSRASIRDRLQSVEILKDIPKYAQEAENICLSIAQDPKVSIENRLDAAKILKDMSRFVEQAADVCLNIAQSSRSLLIDRLYAAKILKDIPIYAQKAVDIYREIAGVCLCITQNDGAHPSDRLDVAKILKDIPGFEQQAAQAYLSIAQDPNVDASQHLQAAEIVLSLKLPGKDEMKEIVKTIFQSCDAARAINFLNNLQRSIGENDPIFQDLLACYIACENQDDPNSPLSVYKEMLKKRDEVIQHKPLEMKIAGETVTLSISLMSYPEEHIKALITYGPSYIGKMKGSLEEAYENSKEHIGMLLGGTSINKVLSVLEKPFFKSFLGKDLKTVLDHKFHIILDKIWDGYYNTEDSLEASQLFIQFLMNIQGCETGEKDGVEHTYRLLSQDRIMSENLTAFRLQDEIKKFLTEQFTKEKEKAILDLVQGKVGSKKDRQHDTRYVKDVIGDAIGLYPETEKRPVDWNGSVVSESIRSLSRQELLTLFYGYFRPDHLVALTQDLFNQGRISFDGETEKNVSWAVINATLNNITVEGVADGTDGINPNYFLWDEEGEPVGITPVGALKILQMLGFVQNVNG